MMLRSLCGSRADFDQRYHGRNELQDDVGRGIGEKDLVKEDELGGDYMPVPGGPFSAMIPSLWPQKFLKTISESPEGVAYDEFGFVKSSEDTAREVFTDNASLKLQWLAHLEFSVTDHKKDDKMAWDKMHHKVAHTEKLRIMILDGIPHSLRPQMWMRLSGAVEKKFGSEIAYGDIVRSSIKISRTDDKIIERDILRIFPSHPCFSNQSSTGTNRLRRVLRSLVWMYPNIGYCPGYCSIVAPLLLFMEENDAFWMMTVIIETLLPPSYFAHGMLGAQADQKVLLELIEEYLPDISVKFKKEDIDLTLVTISWFMSLFSNVLSIASLLPLWDWFFCDGSVVLFQTTLGMLKQKSENMLQLESAVLFNYLSSLPTDITSIADTLKEFIFQTGASLTANLSPEIIHLKRQKHLAAMMASTGSLFAPNFPFNMPNLEVSQGSTNYNGLFRGLLTDHSTSSKQKNIRQTELIVNLREAILIICRHFQTHDPQIGKINTVADYSPESHLRDREVYGSGSRSHCRRAKAIMDFERSADDELGFRKNDVIMIVSQNDEHCWIGELNGLRGWFPARFAELLDERGKEYSPAGDDAVHESIGDLVRETLCTTLLTIFEHGLKSSIILGTSMHPWFFIEEVTDKEINQQLQSVYARLNLCNAYKLDEDSRVLSPEELLYKAVQNINATHDAVQASPAVKFRSFICSGLNDQVLHLWLEVLCSCRSLLEKWYQEASLLRSPAWMQIKCELRILSQLCFTLSLNAELHSKKANGYPLRGSVRELLVKYHLFSWELQ